MRTNYENQTPQVDPKLCEDERLPCSPHVHSVDYYRWARFKTLLAGMVVD